MYRVRGRCVEPAHPYLESYYFLCYLFMMWVQYRILYDIVERFSNVGVLRLPAWVHVRAFVNGTPRVAYVSCMKL